MATAVYFDLTNTLEVGFVTGIQRFSRAMVREFADLESGDLHFIPVRYCHHCRLWVRVTPDDMSINRVGSANPLFPLVLRSVSKKFLPAAVKSWVRWINHRVTRAGHCRQASVDFENNSVFLDIDSAWHSRPERGHLLPALRDRQVLTMAYIHDLVPVLTPELCHPQTVSRFRSFIDAHLANGSAFTCNSEDSRRGLVDYATLGGFQLDVPCIAKLGLKVLMDNDIEDEQLLSRIRGRRIVLCVGTLEPRKNQGLLIEVMGGLFGEFEDVVLVLVGRAGWCSDEIIEKLNHSGLRDSCVIWLSRCEDETLAMLYRKAYLYVTPSLHEGFGLPLAEALSAGCVSLSSNRGALPETGGDFADYFDPTNRCELKALLRRYLGDASLHQVRHASLDHYRPPSWQDTALDLAACVQKNVNRLQ